MLAPVLIVARDVSELPLVLERVLGALLVLARLLELVKSSYLILA